MAGAKEQADAFAVKTIISSSTIFDEAEGIPRLWQELQGLLVDYCQTSMLSQSKREMQEELEKGQQAMMEAAVASEDQSSAKGKKNSRGAASTSSRPSGASGGSDKDKDIPAGASSNSIKVAGRKGAQGT